MTTLIAGIGYKKATSCEGWWPCLSSGEQTALIITAAVCLTALVIGLAFALRKRR